MGTLESSFGLEDGARAETGLVEDANVDRSLRGGAVGKIGSLESLRPTFSVTL